MGTTNKDISRFDVTAVYTHPEAHVDIILLHGLNGNPQKTWTSKKSATYWPTDLLPKTFQEEAVHANVLVYGYNADVAGNKDRNPSTNFIHEHAQTLVNYLTTFRKTHKTLRNPIIWVAHSLGGILLKKALEYSDSVRVAVHEDYRSVYVSTYAIVFLGTPHEGSDLARWGEMLQGMVGHVPRKFFDSEPILIKTLRKDSETLDNINEGFLHIQQRFKIHLVHENQKSDLKGTKSLIVESKSAAPRWYGVSSYGIEADHSGMCKFDGFNAPGYRQITSVICEWVRESPDLIRVRWNVEDQDRRNRAQLENMERARPFLVGVPVGTNQIISVERNETASTLELPLPPLPVPRADAPPSPLPMLPVAHPMQALPPAPSQPPPSISTSQPPSNRETQTSPLSSSPTKEPLFIHPEAFRPNSYFVGREDELKDLHRILQDPKRRAQGTSAVLLRCQTGGGKTHMARQYVFEHRGDYPGGIFWLRASTVQELEDEFWRIARTVALRDLKRKRQQQQASETETEGEGEDDLRDHTKVVDHVRRWFNSLEDSLLVLDGIMFDPGVARFVPDAPRTSMILTSTSPTGAGDHHFNNPKLLELPLLSTREAQELLLLEMEKKKPWTRDDLRQAADLAQLLERLPLMIHVTAQHLKTTYEPLGTFLKRYRAKPQVGNIPAYEFVLEQLTARGAVAALNVLSVLAFFEQHTPVEMMVLGLRALDKSTPYKTRDAATHQKPSLNNTLKVLIAFALVDRTDSYDLSPTSSRTSKKSLDLPGESMDTLRMHSVIQRYLIEYLASKKQHVFWLGRSVEVFCKAFGEADARIKENPRVGMPDDYKRFLLHGKRLLAHLKHYARRSPEELQPLRRRMEDKLPVIEAEADRLHKEIQAKIVGQEGPGSGDMYQQTSIFDRANSLSESDSGTTSSQSHSQQDWTPLDEDFSGYFLSPVVAAADQLYNAYGVPVLPYPVDDDDDDDNAIEDEYDDEEATPVLQQDTPKGGFPPAGALFGESGWQTITEPPRAHAQQPWQQKKSSSSSTALLTSRGKEENNHKSSPAGVSVSRHTAEAAAPRRGSHVSSRNSLAEIRKHSPTPPRGGGRVIKGGGAGRSSSQASTTSSATRPLTTTGPVLSSTTGANHHGTQVAAGLTPAPSPAEFSTATASSSLAGVNAASSGGVGGSPSGWTSTGGRRSDESSRSGGAMPPFPALATLSTRSSPGQGAGPFYPPGPPVERHSNSSLRLVVEHAQPPSSYHPGMGMGGLPRVESSSLGQDDDGVMTMSYPPPRTTTTAERSLRRQPGGVFTPPPPPLPTTSMPLWPPGGLEAEESSTPMSRSNNNSTSGGGGMNSPAYGSRHRSPDSTPGGGVASPSATGNTSTVPDRGRRHSSPLASPMMMMIMPPPSSSSSSQQRFSPASATSGRTNCSRPASVVTEPSPRMRPRYDVLDMPYPVPLPPVPFAGMPTPSHHHQQQQQQNARFGGGGGGGGGGTATAHFPRPPLQARQSRYKRAWGKFRSGRGGEGSNNNNHATTTTAGGSTTSRGRSSTSTTMTTQSSPDPSFSSPPVPPAVSGGEPMGRSGSGGIVVVGRGGGRNHERRTMIAFGDAPVDVDGAAQRLRQRREKSFQKGLVAAAAARREGDDARDNNAARVGGMDNNNDDDDKESNKRNIDAGAGGSGVGLGITPKGGGQETR